MRYRMPSLASSLALLGALTVMLSGCTDSARPLASPLSPQDEPAESRAVILLADADGSDARRLTSTEGRQFAESDPAWSPDGSTITFTPHVRHEEPAILAADRVRGSAQVLVPGGRDAAWSPDGTRIAFVKEVSS